MKKVIIIIVAVIFGLGFLWSISYFVRMSSSNKQVFEYESLDTLDIVVKTRASGSIVPREEIEIKPQVSGIISKLYVRAGDFVSRGQVIAEIQVIPDMMNLSNAEARLDRAKFALENAKVNLERNRDLLAKGVIAQPDYESVELNFNNANNEFLAAQENLEIIKFGYAKKAAGFSNTKIKATIAGKILEVPVEIGKSVIESNTFNDGTTIAVVANMKDLIFEGKVDESEVGKIKEGMTLDLTVGAIEEDVYKAKLEYISPKGKNESGSIQFDIEAGLMIDSSLLELRAGYSATASIVLNSVENTLAISESLLQFDDEGKVFVEVKKNEEEFEKKYITIGVSDGIHAQVLEGLEGGEQIKVWNSNDGIQKDWK